MVRTRWCSNRSVTIVVAPTIMAKIMIYPVNKREFYTMIARVILIGRIWKYLQNGQHDKNAALLLHYAISGLNEYAYD